MMLFQSMKTTQKSKKFGNMGHGVGGVDLLWEGRAEKEGEGREKDMLFLEFTWAEIYGAGSWKDGRTNVQSKGDLCAASVCQTPLLDAMSGAGQPHHGIICSGPVSGARETGFSSFFSCLKPSFPKYPVHGVKDPSLNRGVCFSFWGLTQVHKWGCQRGETFVIGSHHGKGKRGNK